MPRRDPWPSRDRETFELTVILEHETTNAYRIRDAGNVFWVPKSQCELTQIPGRNAWALELPHWLAKEKGLI